MSCGVETVLLGDLESYTPCYDETIMKELGTLASGCRNMNSDHWYGKDGKQGGREGRMVSCYVDSGN